MNALERDQLQQFLATLRQHRAQAKDPVADALIRDALASQADATYVLVQRAMALTLALEATQNRLTQLQNATAQAQPAPGASNAVASAPPAQPSLWMRGLVGQVGATALGVATGVVAGGALLQGLQALWDDDAPSPATDVASESPLWDLGEA